jgi:predicted phosphohydrolase
MNLEEAKADFMFLHSLPGKKIIGKGNHDYWWQTKKKLDNFIIENGFDTISILHNNAYLVENKIICGTRGWIIENTPCEDDEKIIQREAGRLELSIECGKKLDINSSKNELISKTFNEEQQNDEMPEIIVFLHYPPAYRGYVSTPICKQLVKNKIKRCYYGHIHSADKRYLISKYGDTCLHLISSDYLNFRPIPIE